MLKQLGPDPCVRGWRVDISDILVSVMLGGLIQKRPVLIHVPRSACGLSAGLWRSVLGRPGCSSYAVIMATISEITTNYRYMPRYAGPTANHTELVGEPSRLQGLKPTLLVSSTYLIAQRYTRCHY